MYKYIYICLDLISNGPKSSVSSVSLVNPPAREISGRNTGRATRPLSVPFDGGSGETRRTELVWPVLRRFEIWEIQIAVLGGSFAFSQGCNQKVGNDSLVHSTWKWDVGDNVGPNAACICSYFSQCRLFHQLGPILSCPFFRSQKAATLGDNTSPGHRGQRLV